MAKGTIKMLVAVMAAMMSSPAKGKDRMNKSKSLSDLSLRKSLLLTNGLSGPQPSRLPNQRQRRKLKRQMA